MTAPTKPAPFVLERFPESDSELWWYVLFMWGVQLPKTAVCPGHQSPFQAFADAYFARHPVNVWKASRGFGGKTFTLSLLGMTELVNLGAFVTILGGSGAQSMRVHETMTELWERPRAPKHLLAKEPTKYDTYLTNGGKVRTLMASQKSVRGAHPQRLRLDEIDEMELGILTAAQGQPMRKKINGVWVDTNTVMSSTHQYPDGTMTWALRTAKERNWPVYHWCYRETSDRTGWLDPQEVERKRMEISQYMWCVPDNELVQTARGDVKVQEIQAGDRVWTREGWKPVKRLNKMSVQKYLTVTTTDGRQYRATAKHRVATPDGWKQTGDLRVGDSILASDPSHVLSVARTALPMALGVGGELRGVMPVGAGVGGSVPRVVNDVVTPAHQLQMAGVGTRGVSTDVVDGQAIRDGADVSVVCETMGVSEPLDPADSVPVLGLGSLPDPALVGIYERSGFEICLDIDNPGSASALVSAGLASFDPASGHLGSAVGTVVCHVESVLGSGTSSQTWDIEVEDCHEFTIQGVILHNSTEYELQEPSLEGRAFDTDAVNLMFDHTLGDFKGADGEYIELEAPRADRDYVTGADWAKEKDWTVIWTYDTTDADNWRVVAYERMGRRPWPVMVGRLSTRWRWYGGKVVHDATGIGNVVSDYIEIPRGARREHLIDVTMGGRVRSDILSNYVSAVESGHIKSPMIEHAYEEHKFATVDDMYGSGHLPDSVSAAALAWSARNTWRKAIGAKPDISIKRAASPWK